MSKKNRDLSEQAAKDLAASLEAQTINSSAQQKVDGLETQLQQAKQKTLRHRFGWLFVLALLLLVGVGSGVWFWMNRSVFDVDKGVVRKTVTFSVRFYTAKEDVATGADAKQRPILKGNYAYDELVTLKPNGTAYLLIAGDNYGTVLFRGKYSLTQDKIFLDSNRVLYGFDKEGFNTLIKKNYQLKHIVLGGFKQTAKHLKTYGYSPKESAVTKSKDPGDVTFTLTKPAKVVPSKEAALDPEKLYWQIVKAIE